MDFDFTTLPNEDAARAIAYKTPVGRKVFDKLLPELKARAFVVTGLEELRALRAIRDAIAELPRGLDWDTVKKKVMAELYAGDFSEKACEARAELLIRHHGFMAYSMADYEVKQQVKESFPYWKYQTMGDHRVRASHAALDGLVLPADHPFWKDHYPPWEWGCRCQIIEITEDEYNEIKGRTPGSFNPTEDEKAQGWTLTPEGENRLRDYGTLDDGSGVPVDVRSPRVKDGPGAFGWSPEETGMKASDLHRRYTQNRDATAETDWEKFYKQMQDVTIKDQQGRDCPAWDWVIRDDVRAAAEEARLAAQEKGVEVLVAVDYKTGERFGGLVYGKEDRVNVAKTMEKAEASKTPIAVIHTHGADAGVPSPADIELVLEYREWMKRMGVIEWNGVFHWVREGKKWEKMTEKEKDFWRLWLPVWQEKMPYEKWVENLERLGKKGIVEHETHGPIGV